MAYSHRKNEVKGNNFRWKGIDKSKFELLHMVCAWDAQTGKICKGNEGQKHYFVENIDLQGESPDILLKILICMESLLPFYP